MPERSPLLVEIMGDLTRLPSLDAPRWDILIRQARHANLLARLAEDIAAAGRLQDVPEAPRRHLIAASHLARRQHHAVEHETDELRRALATAGLDVVLLKGAAYVLAGLPAARGRVFSDIDILVPREAIGQAESALMMHGWEGAQLSDYDQRYYRRWMHELPPMQHRFRGSALDVHHTILPPTARYHPDPAALLADSVEVAGWPGVRVLAPVDMVLHSATHLFHEGEADNALRDLSDLDRLLRHFAARSDQFWPQLLARAEAQQLTHPLWLALRYTRDLLGTPVPENVRTPLAQHAPGRWRRAPLDAMYHRVLRPQHASCTNAWTPLARSLLYIRGHWLRMPPHLLLVHLLRKALTPEDKPSTEEEEKQRAA